MKSASPAERDRTYLTADGQTRQVAVHVMHDLPHLVVESFFGIDDGLWAELAAGRHEAANRAATARGPKRQKLGRIVSGAASGAPTGEWLTPGHRASKTVTNAVTNRFEDGPDTPAGVRARLATDKSDAIRSLIGRLDDDTIAGAIHGVREAERLWMATPPGGTLRLQWPMRRDP
ncbi:MAG TPA: hypothetical protein VFA70_01500 [Dehalococcoidia bacterium]|nr:hypothetical protein [Dehalococcoidia bacterium]